ncbi:hypothetical protein N2152v2_001559 [Parachlorella kessleri]
MPEQLPEPQVIIEDGESSDAERLALLHHAVGRTFSFETSKAAPEAAHPTLAAATVAHEVGRQARLALPLALSLLAQYSVQIISMSFAGQLGTQELAVVALGSTLYGMGSRLVLLGLCGALDTYASQAAGSGSHEALGLINQRATLFLLAHTLPITGFFLGLPHLLTAIGQPEELAQHVGRYLLTLLPAVWVDAFYRPLNRTLVALGIVQPQMWVGGLAAAQHLGATYLCVFTFRWGYLGPAVATVWTNALQLLLLAGLVWAAGLAGKVWCRPSWGALKGWGAFGRLAYYSAAMKCLESWGFHVCSIVSGLLPDPESAVAAMGVALSTYGLLYMPSLAQSIAASTRVGNALGAGNAALAKLAALAACVSTPLVWMAAAAILLAHPSQHLLISLFTSGEDEMLLRRIRGLLHIVVVLLGFDGAQTVMSGVVSGAGKQAWGFLINAASFWGLALPTALMLGFHFKLGVEGLYWGMTLGPGAQCVCYLLLLGRLQWQQEAEAALVRLRQAQKPGKPANSGSADTWLGQAFLRLFPGPLYYVWFLAVPFSLLVSAYGASQGVSTLKHLAEHPALQGFPRLTAVLAAGAASPAAAIAFSTAVSYTAVIYVFVAIPLLDLLFGQDLRDPLELPFKPKRPGGSIADKETGKLVGGAAGGCSEWAYRFLVYAFIPVHYGVLLFAMRVACSGLVHPLAAMGVTLSAGFAGGMVFTVSHELLHGSRFDRFCSNLLLASVGYMHWTESHLAHHIKVATPEDPSSSRRGETLYAFMPRSVRGNLADGIALEKKRLAAAGLPLLSLQNRMLLWVAAPLALLLAAFSAYGWSGVAFGVVQALLAIVDLETVNYIEHYGLTRRKGPSGRYERVGPRHSWTAGHLFTNAHVFRLQRHADHHEFARKPYQTLRDLPDSSQLPADYPALMIAALFPPLFFRIMNPLLDDFERRTAATELHME